MLSMRTRNLTALVHENPNGSSDCNNLLLELLGYQCYFRPQSTCGKRTGEHHWSFKRFINVSCSERRENQCLYGSCEKSKCHDEQWYDERNEKCKHANSQFI